MKTEGQAMTVALDGSSSHWVYCTVQLGANYHQNDNNRETFKCLNSSTAGLTLQGTNFISHVFEKLKQYVTIPL